MNANRKLNRNLASAFVALIIVVAALSAIAGSELFPRAVTFYQTVTETIYTRHIESKTIFPTTCLAANDSPHSPNYVMFSIVDAQTRQPIPDIMVNQLIGPATSMTPIGNWKTDANGITLTNIGVSYGDLYPFEFTYERRTVTLGIMIIEEPLCIMREWYFPIYIEVSTVNKWHQLTERTG